MSRHSRINSLENDLMGHPQRCSSCGRVPADRIVLQGTPESVERKLSALGRVPCPKCRTPKMVVRFILPDNGRPVARPEKIARPYDPS
jgi:hypothetical protein